MAVACRLGPREVDHVRTTTAEVEFLPIYGIRWMINDTYFTFASEALEVASKGMLTDEGEQRQTKSAKRKFLI